MTTIPKNNLKERMQRLGYNPNIVKIVAPTLDNSKVIKNKPKIDNKPIQSTYKSEVTAPVPVNFVPPKIDNIDDWSDFEDE